MRETAVVSVVDCSGSSGLVSTELQAQVNQMTSDLKEERVAGKRLRAELQQLQDDHAEVVAERDSLQKV